MKMKTVYQLTIRQRQKKRDETMENFQLLTLGIAHTHICIWFWVWTCVSCTILAIALKMVLHCYLCFKTSLTSEFRDEIFPDAFCVDLFLTSFAAISSHIVIEFYVRENLTFCRKMCIYLFIQCETIRLYRLKLLWLSSCYFCQVLFS